MKSRLRHRRRLCVILWVLFVALIAIELLFQRRLLGEAHNAGFAVMPGGEHWFHTPEQMQFLDDWMKNLL